MSSAQPPHYLVKSKTIQPLTGLQKLEGNPSVPAELAVVQEGINGLIDNAEMIAALIKLAPIAIIKLNADGTLSSMIGDGNFVAVDSSIPGAYVFTFESPHPIGHGFVNVYAANSFGDVVSIDNATNAFVVNVRTGGVLTQQPFSVALYRLS